MQNPIRNRSLSTMAILGLAALILLGGCHSGYYNVGYSSGYHGHRHYDYGHRHHGYHHGGHGHGHGHGGHGHGHGGCRY